MTTHYQILIIGGGTGGIMTAAQLIRKNKNLNIAIIDPAEKHYYQPAWTLVGAGDYSFKKTAKAMKDVIPKGVSWIQDRVESIEPEINLVATQSSGAFSYDYLVVAPGLVMQPDMIEGLAEALGKGVVCSNYTDPEHTWEVLKNFKGGNAVFTQPTTQIKCGGAPQKIAYLAADYIRKKSLSSQSKVVFATPGSVIFGVEPIRKTLEKVIERYHMYFKPHYAPFKIDSENQKIYFKLQGVDNPVPDEELGEKLYEQSIIEMPYDMLHIAPPQKAPDFIEKSILADKDGWLDVDHHSLQHKRFHNIFGLGDVAALPTAKTGAAIRKQVPVVVDNLLKLMDRKEVDNFNYNGYSSCPLVTAYGKMALAEFDYEGKFTPDPKLKQLLIKDSSKEHWRLWMLKKYGLPYLYWHKMLKGKEV